MTTLLWSSPSLLGRASSPLNPNAPRGDRSSSPLSSPTPFASSSSSVIYAHSGSPPLGQRHSQLPHHHSYQSHGQAQYRAPQLGQSQHQSQYQAQAPQPRYQRQSNRIHTPPAVIQTRYARPKATARRHSSPAGNFDLFSTEGTTPTEGAMWREKFSRRIEERAKRKRARDADLDRRRSVDTSDELMDEEEADRIAQQDDEEIFRRLMVLQRRKAQHAQLVSHDIETGGSDPLLPEFWEDELSTIQEEERKLASLFDGPRHLTIPAIQGQGATGRPFPGNQSQAGRNSVGSGVGEAEDADEEMWALEAAQAEQAEREAEEEDLASRVEAAYGVQVTTPRKVDASSRAMQEVQAMDLDIDWDAMDMED